MAKVNTVTSPATPSSRVRSLLWASGASIAICAGWSGSAMAQVIDIDNSQTTQVDPVTGDVVNIASDVTFDFTGTGNDDLSSNIRVDNGADGVTINNDGVLINRNTNDEEVAIFVDNGEDSTIINNTGTIQGVDGVIFIEGDNATINNSGLIEGLVGADANEGVIYLDRDAEGVFTINNTATGIIRSTDGGGGPAIGIDGPDFAVGSNNGVVPSVVIDNAGVIENLDENDSDSDAININGDPGSGVSCDPCAFDINITNSGTISAVRDSSSNAAIRFEDDAIFQSGTITNTSTGLISGHDNGIYIGNGTDSDAGLTVHTHGGTIDNAGRIEATQDRAIRVDGGGITIINRAGGVITGPGEGIYFDQGSGDDAGLSGGTVENAGTISSAEAAITIRGQSGTTLTNTGMILGLDGSGSERAVLEVTGTAADVTIVNDTGGVITTEAGFEEEAVGIDATGADISFTNNGTVSATGASADAVIISGGTLAEFSNSGTIASTNGAGLVFDGSDLAGTLTNSGTIEGATASVDATSALSILTFVQDGGALFGDFIGSNAGTDSLTYVGNTALTNDILNDVAVTVDSGAALNILGARTIDGSLTSDGLLDFVLGTDSLTVTGNVTLNTGSVIEISDLNGAVTAVGDQFTLITSSGTLTNNASLTDTTTDASFLLDFVVVSGMDNILTVEAIQAITNSTVVGNGETFDLDADITALTDLVVQGGGILDIIGDRSLNGNLTSAGALQFILGTDSLDVSGNVDLTSGGTIEIADLNGAVTGVGDQFTLITAGGTLTNGASLVNNTVDSSFLLDFVMLPGMSNSVVVEAIAALESVTGAQVLANDITVNTFFSVAETGILDIQGSRSLTGNLISDGILQFTLGTDSLAVSGDVFLNSGSSIEINDLNGAVTAVGDQFTLITAGGSLTNDAMLVDVTADQSFLLDFVVVDSMATGGFLSGTPGSSVIVEAISAIAQDIVFNDIATLSDDIVDFTDVTVGSDGVLNISGARSLNGSLTSNGTLAFVLGTDSLDVTGDVTLNNGSTVQIDDLNGAVTGIGDEFTLITSGGTLTNGASLVDVTEDASFLVDFEVTGEADGTYTVRAIEAGGTAPANTSAARPIADTNLNQFGDAIIAGFNGGTLATDLFVALAEVPDEEGFADATLALMPTVTNAVPLEMLENYQDQVAFADRRLRSSDTGVWAQAAHRSSEQEPGAQSRSLFGYEADTVMVAFGADGAVGENIKLGASYAYSDSDIEHSRGEFNETLLTMHQIGAYAGTNWDTVFLNASVNYATGSVEETRVGIGSAILGEYDVDAFFAHATLGMETSFNDRITVTPATTLTYGNFSQDSFQETGGLNLAVTPDDVTYFEARAGMDADAVISQSDDHTFMANLRLGISHNFDTDGQVFGVNSSSLTAPLSLTADGVDGSRFDYGVGIEVVKASGMSLRLEANQERSFTTDYDNTSLLGRFRLQF